jgi:CRP/FNR family cyclic AMP-dependent transcriptional regulator
MNAKWKGRPVSVSAGEKLFDLEHSSREMFLLQSGHVRLTGRNGVIFDHLKRGSFFGVQSLFGPNAGRQVATALSQVEAIAFGKSDLLAECKRDPRSALRLVKDLAQRLDRYEESIVDMVTEKTEIRLARLLLRQAPNHPRSGWVRLPFRFTNVELAKMVGTTRWRVSHLLSRFQRLGWLRRDPDLWLHREGILEYLPGQ